MSNNYHKALSENPDAFYKTCCVFINQELRLNPDWPDVKRLGYFIYLQLEPQSITDIPEFEQWELDFRIQDTSFKSEFKKFARWFVESKVSDLADYKSRILEGASFTEQCFAIWSNVVELEADVPTNSDYARSRVEEYMKGYYIVGYQDTLKEWECELH